MRYACGWSMADGIVPLGFLISSYFRFPFCHGNLHLDGTKLESWRNYQHTHSHKPVTGTVHHCIEYWRSHNTHNVLIKVSGTLYLVQTLHFPSYYGVGALWSIPDICWSHYWSVMYMYFRVNLWRRHPPPYIIWCSPHSPKTWSCCVTYMYM